MTTANLGLTLAVVLALGGGAFAAASSIPGPGGVIHGCYKKKQGNLRVVPAGKKCKKGEKALAFNQRGPQGAAGHNGVSQSFESFKDSSVDVASTNSAAATGIGSLLLPPGNYQVIAKVHMFQSGTSSATFTPINCVLSGGGEGDTARGTINNTDTDQTLTMIARAQVAASTNEFVACWRDNTNNQISADKLKIAAIQVNTANDVPSG